VSLSLIQFSFAQLLLSPISLSLPRCALGLGDDYRRIWIPEVSSPSLSLSLPPLPLSSSPCALYCPVARPVRTASRRPGGPVPRCPACPAPRPQRLDPPRWPRAPAPRVPVSPAPGPMASHPGGRARPPGGCALRPGGSRPLAGPAHLPMAPRRAPVAARAPRAPGSPCASPWRDLTWLRRAKRVPTYATVVAQRLTFGLIHFKLGIVNVLRRALRRATIHLKFVLILD
jgi:hypothetical protein